MSKKQLMSYIEESCDLSPEKAADVIDAVSTYVALAAIQKRSVLIEGMGVFTLDINAEKELLSFKSDEAMDAYIRIQAEASGPISEGDEEPTIRCKKTQRCPQSVPDPNFPR